MSFAFTIFCEDIRQEMGGRVSYMGIYGGGVDFPALPSILPKLCIVTNYIEGLDESDEPVTLLVFMPGDSDDAPTVRFPLPIEPARSKIRSTGHELEEKKIIANLPLQLHSVEFRQEGLVRVQFAKGAEIVKGGNLKIAVNPAAYDVPSQATSQD